MADKKPEPEQKDGAESNEAPRRRKHGLFLGGGVVTLVALAYVLFLVAVPRAQGDLPLKGPFVITLCQGSENVQANLAGDGGKRFLSMVVQAEYRAYEEGYAVARALDPLYQAKERDAILFTTRKKTKADLDDELGVRVYKRELKDALDPLLFPIHVGDPSSTAVPHANSGLLPGKSSLLATLRGGFHAHSLLVDARNRTITLDEGAPVAFDGSESDLLLQNEFGHTVYLDVTELKDGFEGSVPVGTFGRIENVFFGQFIVQ